MCRKKYMHGCCVASFGFGLIVGHCLESWVLCCGGGVGLLIFGLCIMAGK